MIGKTFLDVIGLTKNEKTESLKIVPEIEREPLNELKNKIKDCSTPVEIDTKLKGAGLQDIEKLSERVKELHAQGNIDQLERGEVNDIIKEHNYTNIAEQAHGYTGVNAALKKYKDNIRNNTEDTRKFTEIMSKSNASFANYIRSLNGAEGSMVGYGASLVAAKIKTLALRASTIALNMALTMGIGYIIGEAVSWIYSMFNAQGEAIEAAAESVSELKSNLQTLDDYKAKIIELKTALDSSTISYEAAKEKREELMNIQNELISQYGSEAAGIDLVTGSLEEQKEALENLKIKKSEEWLNENQSGINGAKENLEDSGEILIKNANAKYTERLANRINSYNWTYEHNYIDRKRKSKRTKFRANSDDLTIEYDNYYDAVEKLSQLLEDLRNEKSLLEINSETDTKEYEQTCDMIENVSDKLKELKEDNSEALDVYNQYTEHLLLTNDKYRNIWTEITKAKEEYQKALINGASEEEINAYADKLATVYNGIDLSKIEDDGVREKIKEIMETSDDIVAEHRFKLNLTINDGKLKSDLDDAVSNLGGIDNISSEDILNFDKMGIDDSNKIKAYNNLQDYADELEMSMEQLVSNMEKTGIVNSKVFNDLASNPNLSEYKDKLKTLTKEQLEFLSLQKSSNGDWKSGWIEPMEDFRTLLKKIETEMSKIKKEAETPLSFIDSMKELGDFTDALSKLDKIYADVYDKEGFDFSSLTNEDFIETFGKYNDEYENLVNTISNSPDDINACQSAFNNLVAAWLNGENVLKNLTEENKEATIAYLNQNGIANASAIVTNRLAAEKLWAANQTNILADAENILAAEDNNAAIAANNNTMELLNQSGATAETINWVMKLVAEEEIFGNTSLNVEDKIAALERLANAYGQTAFAASLAARMQNAETVISGLKAADSLGAVTGNKTNYTDDYLNSILEEEKAKFNNLSAPTINFTGGSAANSARSKGSKGGSGGSGSKGAESKSQKEHETNDEYYNYYESKVEDFKNGAKKLEEQIEETNAQIEFAYEKGDIELAENLKKQLSNQRDMYKEYLSGGSQYMREMANNEILPIIYEIAPEFKGKTIDQISEEEKKKVKERLDNEIVALKNKAIDLENAGKSDSEIKAAESEIKNKERQLKILEEMYPVLENIYDLSGNKNGQGEWAKEYRDTLSDEIDEIKDSFDKAIEQQENNLSLFEDTDDFDGQLKAYLKMLEICHRTAEEYRKKGLKEDSESIKETQKKYRDTKKEISDLYKEKFNNELDKEEDNLSLFEDTENYEEAVKTQLKMMEICHNSAEEYRKLGLSEDSEYIKDAQKKYREHFKEMIDILKDKFNKEIDEEEFNLSFFENMDNDKGQINSYLKMLEIHAKAADDFRKHGLDENSDAIKESQEEYIESFKKVFDILNETFEKFMQKRYDLSDKIDFRIDTLGDKEYDENTVLLKDKISLSNTNINYIVKEQKRLEDAYKNSTICASEYEEQMRSLKELEREQIQTIKECYENIRDIETAKIDDQINDITEATEKQTKAIDKQIKSLQKESDALSSLKDLYDKAYKAVQKIIDEEVEKLNKAKEKEEEYWNAKLEALEKINEETQRGIELSEKQQAVEKAGQKTALVYHEDTGYTYEANPNELSAAQQDLNQWIIDDQFNQAKKSIEEQKEAVLNSIDEQIEGWNTYLDLWGDALNAFDDKTNDAAAKTVIGLNYSSKVMAQNMGIVSKFEKDYSDILSKIGDETSGGIAKQIKDLEKQKETIEESSDAKIEALEGEKKVWEELFSQGMIENVDSFVAHFEEQFGVMIGKMEFAREVLQAFSNDMNKAMPNAEEIISYNDEDTITIKRMHENSQQWAKADNQKNKDQLFERNKKLSELLSFDTYFDSHSGTWLDENGNNIYSRLSKDYINTQANTKAEIDNTQTTEDNTNANNNNTKVLKSQISESKKIVSSNKELTNTIKDSTNTIEKASERVNSSNSGNNFSGSNNSNSTSNSSNSNSSSYTSNTPYTYTSTLKGEDIAVAKQWFDSKKKTYPGSNVKVIGGDVSSLSPTLISQLGLKSRDLVVLGKRLYYIDNSVGIFSKISSSLVNKYEKGSEYIPYSQLAVIDEKGVGSELIVHKDSQGRPKYLEQGSEVVAAKPTQSLTNLLKDMGDSHVIEVLENIRRQHDPINRIINDMPEMPEYISNGIQNTNTVNNNYNIEKVVLEQVNNVEDIFRGLKNKAIQWAYRR